MFMCGYMCNFYRAQAMQQFFQNIASPVQAKSRTCSCGFKSRLNVPTLLGNICWIAMLDALLNVAVLDMYLAKCSNIVFQHLFDA